MFRTAGPLFVFAALAAPLAAEEPPLTEGQKARIAALKAQIAEKKAELLRLEAELAKLPAGPAAGMNEWTQVGDVRVRLTRCKIQKVPLLGSDRTTTALSKEPELMVWFEVQNVSEVRKVEGVRWRSSPFSSEKPIRDEHDNDYRIYEHDAVEGARRNAFQVMRPGDAAHTEILCVELPVEKATRLRLVLDAAQGEKGKYRFEIPASAWKGEK